MPARQGGFLIEVLEGEVQDLVAPSAPCPARRLGYLVRPRAAAVVLGSTTPEEMVDRAVAHQHGLELVRRRSGGGAVVVAPGAQVWLDLFLPAGDPLFDTDIARTALWLGERWAEAFQALEVRGPIEVHHGGLAEGRFGRLACFSGLGPGEVTVAGAKVVGCSQRRDRFGAWLHSMALLDQRQVDLADVLNLDAGARAGLRMTLSSSTATVAIAAADLELALRAALG